LGRRGSAPAGAAAGIAKDIPKTETLQTAVLLVCLFNRQNFMDSDNQALSIYGIKCRELPSNVHPVYFTALSQVDTFLISSAAG